MLTPDVRLLKVFDEVYKTRSVSRAAENLSLGQPAVSIALGKLREHFGDPLFVRTSSGMEPTPFGQTLIKPMRAAIEAIDVALGQHSAFDPALSRRVFTVAMTDTSQMALLPDLLHRIREVAPNVQIRVVSLSTATGRRLEAGEVDLAIGFMPELDAGFYQQTLFRQHYVCLVSAGHPRVREQLDLAAFEREEHAVVRTSGSGHQIIEREIARQNIKRRVAVTIPDFVGAAFVAEATDLVATIPGRLSEALARRGRFRIFPVPFPMPEYAIKQHWHERYHYDLGSQWLRGLIRDLLGGMNDPVRQYLCAPAGGAARTGDTDAGACAAADPAQP
ncbi:LysR family transcriptional regulator [Thiohalocapsa marina]|uniref:LysR family transcriptional regulator n=1 Tax=Thiohalocapsa marina TaxID=424902 RepID=A0A5M8FRX6_9GAMM|nr:LysR family transcriptional regulator [Thiohalocapsa marina]KAA6184302.1 LysR family transcriptional regulator [Thiohalocapsa marina]